MRLTTTLRTFRTGSLREVQDITGISPARLSQFETGQLLPRDSELEALTLAYGAGPAQWYPPDVLLAIQLDPPAEQRR